MYSHYLLLIITNLFDFASFLEYYFYEYASTLRLSLVSLIGNTLLKERRVHEAFALCFPRKGSIWQSQQSFYF